MLYSNSTEGEILSPENNPVVMSLLNFQLLCAKYNLTKNDTLQLPNYQYQMYWK